MKTPCYNCSGCGADLHAEVEHLREQCDRQLVELRRADRQIEALAGAASRSVASDEASSLAARRESDNCAAYAERCAVLEATLRAALDGWADTYQAENEGAWGPAPEPPELVRLRAVLEGK